MSAPSKEQILAFVDEKVTLWNAGKREELAALYKAIAPNEVIFEYVGLPIEDGWKALDDMWDRFGDEVEMEIIETLINGNEVACYIHNHRRSQPGAYTATVETYVFENGNVHERYYFSTELKHK